MRNLKKFLALVLAMMMTLSLMVTVNASSFTDKDFTDDYTEAVDVLAALGVINGYGDGTFLPKEKIDRCEVAAILYRIVTGDVDSDNIHLYDGYSEFTDVAKDAWYTPYVNFCANNGLINGVGNNRFAPKAKITGYEALVMILRAIGYNNPTEFSSSDWKFKASGYGTRLGITANIPAGSLGAEATREMVAEIMFQGLLVPTVTYSPLTMYTNNVLVKAFKDDADRAVYASDVYSTLMFETFGIVGKREVLGRDNYGRPVVEWVRDNPSDTTLNGGKYIVNTETNSTPMKNVDPYTPGALYDDMNEDGSTNDRLVDVTALSIAMTPVKTYYTKVTECQVAKDVNGDKTMRNVSEWVNGGRVKYSWWNADPNGDGNEIDATNATSLTRSLDALHTTTDTIGAQGRTTEIYNIGKDGVGNIIWNIIYVDTLMGVVTKVEKRTFDTNGHVYHPAKLYVEINDGVSGSTAVEIESTTKDFTEKVDDLVLVTTYGFNDVDTPDALTDKDGNAIAANTVKVPKTVYINETARASKTSYAADGATPGNYTAKISDIVSGEFAIPDKTDSDVNAKIKDFKVDQWVAQTSTTYVLKADNKWAVDLVGTPTSTSITVQGTTGEAQKKVGLIGTDGKTYPASNVYCKEASVVATYDSGTAVPDDYSILMTNNLINRTFTLYLDGQGNIVGMTEGSTNNIGVITDLEPVRVGVGKWVMETEVFHADNTTSTVKLLTWNDTASKFEYVLNTDDAVNVKDAADDTNDARWNKLVKYEPVVIDGQTYYGVIAVGVIKVDNTDPGTGKTGVMVEAGVADSLWDDDGGSGKHAYELSDGNDIIMASTTFDYSVVDGQNTGAQVLGGLKGYDGFKAIPTIVGNYPNTLDATSSVSFQRIDDVVYIYPTLKKDATPNELRQIAPGVSYGFVAKPTITVDESYLVLSTVATYQDHATYRVIKNGEVTTLDVANVNDNVGGGAPLNTVIEGAMANHELIRVLSKDLNGYATSIQAVDNTQNLGQVDMNGDNTFDGTMGQLGTSFYLVNSVINTIPQLKTSTIPVSVNRAGAQPILVSYSDSVLTIGVDGNKDGVIDATNCNYLTIDDNCKVQIVNVATGNVYDGTIDNVMQYRKAASGANISELVYELNANGYVCNIYIID